MAILDARDRLRAGIQRWLFAWGLAWGAFIPAAFAQPVALTEYQIKAVFLFNFTRFVEWPPLAFEDERAPIVIGVLGEDPFGRALEQAASGENVNGLNLIVQRYRFVAEIGTCHVLFISRSETKRLDEILAALKGRSLLTVGDAEDFSQHGGMIRFVMENHRVRLRINPEAAKAAHLAISSKLLRPADIVVPGKG